MSEKKKKQHYVWRAYLRAWASKESIWTYFKEQNKIAGVGLMGVGQERYFYKLVTFTEEEEKFLKRFIEHSCHYTVQPLCLDFLKMFTSHYKLQKALDEITNSTVDREYIQKEIDKLEANLMEDVHGKFESQGQKLINCRDLEDFSF